MVMTIVGAIYIVRSPKPDNTLPLLWIPKPSNMIF